jgi:hypothetical protein
MSTEIRNIPGPNDDFETIQSAVKETERGRWFLSEFERRGRSAETQALLDAVGKLEKIVRAAEQEVSVSDTSPEIAQAIRTTRTEVEAPEEGEPWPKATGFSCLAVQARSLAVELSQLCEIAQQSFKDSEVLPGTLQHLSQRLFQLGSSQDLLARKLAKATNLFDRLDRQLNGDTLAARLKKLVADARHTERQSPLSQENLKYFGQDEEIFNPEQLEETKAEVNKAQIGAAEEAAKARIVIVRTPNSATQIPLAEEIEKPGSAA